ncbi:hypothetical protein ACVDFE_18000 [Lentzea chajnantorensis]
MRIVVVAVLVLMSGCSAATDARLVVEGTGTADQLTYMFPGEDERTLKNPDVPWQRRGARKGRFVVRLEGVRGELTCKIIINGRQVKTATSASGAALACDHSMAV